MVSQANEAALEAHIERALCGSSIEDRRAGVDDTGASYGIKPSAGYEFADLSNASSLAGKPRPKSSASSGVDRFV